MELPKFVAFNSLTNIKYLGPSGPNNNMKFDAMEADSEGVEHEIVKAESDSGLVHIRCCATGKYWRGWGAQNNIIVAQANQPEEDIAKEACTLFKHSHKTKDGVTVVNLQYGYRGSWHPICVYDGCLVAGQTNSCPEDFIISDLESLPPEQPEERALSIGKTTLGKVSIEDGALIGITEIAREVSVDKTYTGRGASIGTLSIGSGSQIRGTPTIGKVSIGGGVSLGKSTPKVEQGRKVRPAVQKKKAGK